MSSSLFWTAWNRIYYDPNRNKKVVLSNHPKFRPVIKFVDEYMKAECARWNWDLLPIDSEDRKKVRSLMNEGLSASPDAPTFQIPIPDESSGKLAIFEDETGSIAAMVALDDKRVKVVYDDSNTIVFSNAIEALKDMAEEGFTFLGIVSKETMKNELQLREAERTRNRKRMNAIKRRTK